MPAGRPKARNPFEAFGDEFQATIAVATETTHPTERLADFCAHMDPTYEQTRHTDAVCAHLEAIERRDIRNLIIALPPRHSKTYHMSERYPAWSMGRSPRQQMILVSYGADLAERNSRRARALLMEKVWPFKGVELSKASHSVAQWETNQGGIVSAVGVGGAITGFGSDRMIVDDYFKNREEADSEANREALWLWWQEVATTRRMPGGTKVVGATRWHEDDLIGRILNSKGAADWTVLVLPAIAEEDDPLGRAEGEALWPERFPISELPSVAKDEMTEASFASLYQQHPTTPGGNLLQEEQVRDLPATLYEPTEGGKSLFEMLSLYHIWDPAFSESERADWMAMLCIGVDSRLNLYILDAQRYHLTPYTALTKIKEVWESRWRPRRILIERPAFRQKTVDDLARDLRTKIMAQVIVRPAQGDKEDRFGLVRERAASGMVYADKQSKWWKNDVWPELAKFPNGKFDDYCDCLSAMCSFLSEAGLPQQTKVSRYGIGKYQTSRGKRRTASDDLMRELATGVKR
jgi:predicted phage terminase large subunit-like protein